MRTSRKLRAAVAIGTVVAIVSAVVAYAYFTSTGSGEGKATVGTASATVKITSTIEGELYPGGTPAKVKLSLKNEGSSSTRVDEVSLTKVTSSKAGCVVSAFTMSPVTINRTLAPGGEATGEGSLSMANTEESQDECQGAELTLSFASN